MKVAIVGNAKPWRDFSAEIESCDVIIRMGAMASRGPLLTGTRTTVYAVHNLDQPMLRGEAVLPDGDFVDLWINTWMASYQTHVNHMLTANGWQSHPFRLLFQEPLHLAAYGIQCASTGLIVTEYVTRYPKAMVGCPNPDVKLFCFTWEGVAAHQWSAEKERCHELQRRGYISIIT